MADVTRGDIIVTFVVKYLNDRLEFGITLRVDFTIPFMTTDNSLLDVLDGKYQ